MVTLDITSRSMAACEFWPQMCCTVAAKTGDSEASMSPALMRLPNSSTVMELAYLLARSRSWVSCRARLFSTSISAPAKACPRPRHLSSARGGGAAWDPMVDAMGCA